MNTKGTEFSLFQGAPSIYVDNNQQRIEEEEARQDQIRRDAELHDELQNAFDDLEDGNDFNDDTMNSTKLTNGNSYHHSNRQYQQPQPFALRDSDSHLRNLMESKVREIEYVTNKLSDERKQNKSVVDEYEKRLAIAEAEKERALMTRDQTHELLVENKSRVIEMEDCNEKLRSRIKSLEIENSSLVGELESTKLMLSDVQIKYNMVEKNVMFNADRNTDSILKQAQERHSAQIAMMQQQIDSLKTKFDDAEHDRKNLAIRYKELQRSRESILIEKGEIINQLNKNLEEAQRQCQELLSRPNLSHENRQLQNLVRSMESQKDDLCRNVSKLQKRLEEQTKEMEMMDSIVQECGGNNFSFSESSKFIHRDPLKNVNSSTPMAPEARLARVKEELCKSLNNIKNKREEIKIFEKQLSEKDEEIRRLKIDENKALVQMNKFRDETIRLESKTKILEQELDKKHQELLEKSASNGHSCITDEKYEEKIRQMEAEKKSLDEELLSLKGEYEQLSMNNGAMLEHEQELKEKIRKLKASTSDTAKLSDELEKERVKVQTLEQRLKALVDDSNANPADIHQDKSAANKCVSCDGYLMKLDQLELSCRQAENANAENCAELRQVKRDLSESHRVIASLEEKLNLKQSRDVEIEMLKKKAEEFEGFMRANTRSASTASSLSPSSPSQTKTDVSTETSDLDDDMGRKLQQSETKIRDELAKIFAREMKTMEKRFRDDAEQLHNRMLAMSEELEEKTHELNVRNEQLQLLKFTIVQEREEFDISLKQKDDDFKVAIEKYRAEYESSQGKVEDLISQLNEKKDLIDEERLSIERLKQQISEERKTLAKRDDETLNKLKKLQVESTKAIEELREKYLSAKQTAMNYKQFAEDNEKHFRSECERYKSSYAELIEKVEKRFKASLAEKDKIHQDRIKKIETEFEFQIEVYKGMLEKRK